MCDAHSAQALVARIHKAVNEFNWGHLRDGLEVTASCGSALAQPQDTLDSWLHRCGSAHVRGKRLPASGLGLTPGSESRISS